MTMKRAFISFDYDNDKELRDTLIVQAENPDSPFQIADCSIHERFYSKWRARARDHIRNSDLTIVICGEHTHTADGVAAELTITREEGKPYFLLRGRPKRTCHKPRMARSSDDMHKWTWDNLKRLIAGADRP